MTNDQARPTESRSRRGRRRGPEVGAVAARLALALSLLVAAAAAASAQPIACADLATIVASAEAEFAPLRGPLTSSIVPGASPLRRAPAQRAPDSADRNEAAREFEKRVLSTQFEVRIHATTRPLAGARSCGIRVTTKEDARSAVREVAYRCDWPSRDGFAALRQSVVACLASAAIREETPESLRLHLERVSSGEGERRVLVSVEAGAAQPARLLVAKLVCRARSPGGCGENPRPGDVRR